ncbi:MAG: insulinase family protein [Bacteroidaceae bacterium]|nr:insulinase family protein [Bacteroidaceae bacterium]
MKSKNVFFMALAVVATLCLASCNKRDYESVKGDPMQTRIYTLKNGLKVYLSVNKDEPRIQANIAVRTGSRNDPAETTGLAHYLEHLMFKGTKLFGTSDSTAEAPLLDEIEQRFEAYRQLTDPAARKQAYHEIDSVSQLAAKYNIPNEYDKLMALIGSDGTNAYTSFDQTVYVENIPSNEIENWARIQADRFQNMVIRGFHTELEAVYEEYNLHLSDDGDKMINALLYKLFPTHPYGTQTTIGTQEHLKNPSITNIKNYFNNYYCPNNVAIFMAGDFDPDKTIDILEKYFGEWQPNPDCKRPEYEPVAALTAPVDTTVVGLEAESLYLGWAFPGAKDAACDTLSLISQVLSNGRAGLIDLDINQRMTMLGAGAGDYQLCDYSLFFMAGSPREGQTLEEARDLLVEELRKLKTGDFPDDILPAIINNMKLNQMRSLESNRARTQMFEDAFINGKDWENEVKRIDRIAALTKEDIVGFAQRHLTDNFVTVFKRQGEDPNIKKIEKPEITAIPANRDKMSAFVKEIQDTEVEPIQPRFVDFKKDLTETNWTSKIGDAPEHKLPLIYKQNAENGIFNLVFRLPFGTAADKRIDAASDYLELLGTDSLTAEQVQQKFYGLACSFYVNAGSYQTSIGLTGLDENMPEALALLENVLKNVKVDSLAYAAYVANIAKAQADAKLEQQQCFSRLRAFGIYGPRNSQRDILTAALLAQTNPQELVDILHSLTSYEHTVLYYGPRSIADLTNLLTQEHSLPAELKAPLAFEDYMEQTTPATEILLAPYDAKNIYMMAFNNDETPWRPEVMPVAALFNEYFGAGMNGIVFQELRESRGLAYSARAYYDQAPDRKGHPETSYTYIISQNDKMMDCIRTFNEILDTLPQSQSAFEIAKQSLTKQLAALRTTRFGVINAWLAAHDRGIDYDINEKIYNALPGITLEDVVKFANERMAAKPRRYMILGNEKELNMAELQKVGPVKRVSLEEVFGY